MSPSGFLEAPVQTQLSHWWRELHGDGADIVEPVVKPVDDLPQDQSAALVSFTAVPVSGR